MAGRQDVLGGSSMLVKLSAELPLHSEGEDMSLFSLTVHYSCTPGTITERFQKVLVTAPGLFISNVCGA